MDAAVVVGGKGEDVVVAVVVRGEGEGGTIGMA